MKAMEINQLALNWINKLSTFMIFYDFMPIVCLFVW